MINILLSIPSPTSFRRGERIGLIGPNGSGKTTFLNLLSDRLQPDSGTIDKGINTHFGYFDQTGNHPGRRAESYRLSHRVCGNHHPEQRRPSDSFTAAGAFSLSQGPLLHSHQGYFRRGETAALSDPHPPYKSELSSFLMSPPMTWTCRL